MLRLPIAVLCTWLGGCGATPSITGQAQHGLLEAPLADFRIVARAVGEAKMTCSVFETTTNADGSFTLVGPCAGVSYRLTDADGGLWFDEDTVVGGQTESVDLTAWWGPSEGVFLWREADTTPIRLNITVQTEDVGGTAVPYPKTVPATTPLLQGTDRLVLTGNAVTSTSIEPVVPSTVKRWWYLGYDLGDSAAVRNAAAIGEVKDVVVGERRVRYIPVSALATGRYGLLNGGKTRMAFVDVGKSLDGEPSPWPAEE